LCRNISDGILFISRERYFVKAKYGNCARNFILSSDASILNMNAKMLHHSALLRH